MDLRMASGPSYMLLCILLLMIVREGVSSSQFLNDFGLCIVDKGLTSSAPELIFSTDPVVERGSAARYTKHYGDIEINDDGTYLFIIHRPGLGTAFQPLLLVVEGRSPGIIAFTLNSGEGATFTAHALAELKRGNFVYVVNIHNADVVGDENRPFIFSVFLLYHKPIVSFPRARQSAFSVYGLVYLIEQQLADSMIDTYAPPDVNIGDGFDDGAGVFTAPFQGLYVFHLAFTFVRIDDGGGHATVALQVNGDTKAQVSGFAVPDPQMMFRSTSYGPPQNSAITVAQNLNQGDEITLLKIIAQAEGIVGYVSFVGYLLS